MGTKIVGEKNCRDPRRLHPQICPRTLKLDPGQGLSRSSGRIRPPGLAGGLARGGHGVIERLIAKRLLAEIALPHDLRAFVKADGSSYDWGELAPRWKPLGGMMALRVSGDFNRV